MNTWKFKRFPHSTSVSSKADQIIDLHISKSFDLEVSNEITENHVFFLGGPFSSFDNLNRLKEKNGHYINIDKGYFRTKSNKFWRLTYKGLQQSQIFNVSDDRLGASICFDLKKWNTSGDYILLLAPNLLSLKYHTGNSDIIQWCLEIKSKILKYTDRKVFIRFKDNVKQRSVDPLSRYLDKCHAVVTLQSIACVESICSGVPVFNLADSCLDGLYKSDISQIENPPKPDNRHEWLKSLAYSQFTITELEDGTAYRILRDLNIL